MSGLLALITPPLNPSQRAVWAHFQKGGSVVVFVMVLLGIGLVLALCWWLNRRSEMRMAKEEPSDPWKVFRGLQTAMKLSAMQRKLLGVVARDLRLANPSVLLLSPALFDRHVARWQGRVPPGTGSGDGGPPIKETITQARVSLFVTVPPPRREAARST